MRALLMRPRSCSAAIFPTTIDAALNCSESDPDFRVLTNHRVCW